MEEKPRSAVKTINAMKARQSFGQMLEEVYYRGEIYIVERAGKPMAALVPLSVLEELQKHSGAAKIKQDTQKGNKRRSRKGKA